MFRFSILYILTLFVCCFVQVSYAQIPIFQLSGQILDQSTQFPIAYATIEVDQKGIGFATSADGQITD